LQARLSLISLALFSMIAGFGVVTIHLFNQVNFLTDELRQVWLPSTRLLGDLNNASSDDRAAEGDVLLAQNADDRQIRQRQTTALAAAVTRTQRAYEHIVHTPAEQALYQHFAQAWQAYLAQSAHVLSLAAAGQHDEAVRLYRTDSRTAYNAASDALGALTDHTVGAAREASVRTAQAYEIARWIIPGALILAFALLLAALLYIHRLLSRPLVEMAATMHRLAANDTDITLTGLGRDDEIGEMSRALRVFRANAIALIESRQGLEQQAAMLEQKLALEQHLAQMQRNFVIMVSHEFRTPLSIIDAHAQRMISRHETIQAAVLAERAARIRVAVQRMTALMDNMLTSGRVLDGQASLFFHPACFDLVELLREVCAFHRESAPNAYIGEEFRSATAIVRADRKLLFQAFSNLLSNAIKYSGEDVFVRVSLTATDGQAVVTIQDRGIGIAAEDIPNLFDRYFRGANARDFVGTGIGLYLVRTVVLLHGGDISVDSAPGQGARFSVSLPQGEEGSTSF
jgi:signal transduction histidine kinase